MNKTTFEQLEVNEHFNCNAPFAEGKLRKVCGNMAENEKGVHLTFTNGDVVERVVIH